MRCLVVALCALILIWPNVVQSQGAAVTSDTLLRKIDETGALKNVGADVGILDCDVLNSPNPADRGRQFCRGNIRRGAFGVSVLVKTATDGKTVDYVGLMMASPKMADEDQGKVMTAVFMICMARVAAALQADVPQERRTTMIETLFRGINRDVNEVRLGSWVYRAGNSIFVSFSGERKMR